MLRNDSHSNSQVSLSSTASLLSPLSPPASDSVSQRQYNPRRLSSASALTVTTNAASYKRPKLAGKKSSGRSQAMRLQALERLQSSKTPREVDLMAFDPSEEGSIEALFMQYGVRDVKAVEDRAVSLAGAKREELRTMVGERYRDLLGAADSIVRMRASSAFLMQSLSNIAQDCSKNAMLSHARACQPQINHRQLASPHTLANPFSLATLIKLFLDTPEHIWTALETEDYLSAARLEALGRAVYKELDPIKADADLNGIESEEIFEAFPLIEKQWEGLQQLSVQVSTRTRASLTHPFASSRSLAHALAAIFLLDAMPVSSLLDLLLNSRAQHLQTLSTTTVPTKLDYSTSATCQIVASMLSTVQECQAIFGPLGLLSNVLAALNLDAKTLSNDKEQRLPNLLSVLPNSHILQKYLPPSIIDFTPSVHLDSSQISMSSSALQSALQGWFTNASLQFQTSLQQCCASAQKIKDLAVVRNALRTSLSQDASPESETLMNIAQETLLKRLQQVLTLSFDSLFEHFLSSLTKAVQSLIDSEADRQPATHLFSSASHPKSVRTSLIAARAEGNRQSFQAMTRDTNKKLKARSPLLDQVLTLLEDTALSLQADMQTWIALHSQSADLSTQHSHHLKHLSDRMTTCLTGLVETHSESTDALIFLARFVRQLIHDDSFLQAMGSSHEAKLAVVEMVENLQRVLQMLFTKIAETIVAEIDNLVRQDHVRDHLSLQDTSSYADIDGVLLPTQPGNFLLHALQPLLQRFDSLSVSFTEDLAAIRDSIMSSLLSRLSKAIRAQGSESADQNGWDLSFLRYLGAVDPLTDTQPPSNGIKLSVESYLRRSQQLFSPLLPPSLDFVAEDRSVKTTPVSIAPKLGARFGLLPVPALGR